MISRDLMLEAQAIISDAERAYEYERYRNGGTVSPEMEDKWYEAMRRAEALQAQAAREEHYRLEHAEDLARDRDHHEWLKETQELRRG